LLRDDPCVTRERLERDDPITQNVSAVLTALHQEFRGKQFSTSDVLNAVRNDGNKGMPPSAPSPLQTIALASRSPETLKTP
jgi:hypothetical protein